MRSTGFMYLLDSLRARENRLTLEMLNNNIERLEVRHPYRSTSRTHNGECHTHGNAITTGCHSPVIRSHLLTITRDKEPRTYPVATRRRRTRRSQSMNHQSRRALDVRNGKEDHLPLRNYQMSSHGTDPT